MGDWTSQNWTKRDGRNNQEEQQEEQEKKATYKTAAELAVKKEPWQAFVTAKLVIFDIALRQKSCRVLKQKLAKIKILVNLL